MWLRTVALSGDGTILAVGAPSYANATTPEYTRGAVYIFQYYNNQWNEQQARVGTDLHSTGVCMSLSLTVKCCCIGDLQALFGVLSLDKFGRKVALSKDGTYLTVGQRNEEQTRVRKKIPEPPVPDDLSLQLR